MPQTQTEQNGSVTSKDPSSLPPKPENNIYLHKQFILNVTAFASPVIAVGCVFSLLKQLTLPGIPVWTTIILAIVSFGYAIAWVVTKKGLIHLGAAILLSCNLVVTTQILFSYALSITSLLAYLANAMLGLILLGAFAAYLISFLSIGIFIFSVVINRFTPFTSNPTDPSKAGISDAVFISLGILVIVWLGNYMLRSLNKTNSELQNQSSSLQKALTDIEEKRALEKDLSH